MKNIVPSFSDRFKNVVPKFFHDDYPLFIKFFEYYYQWKNRNGGFNLKDIEYFSNSFGLDVTEKNDLLEIIRLSNVKSPDQYRNEFFSEYLLERTENIVESSDEEIFLTADDEIYEAPVLNMDVVNNSIKDQGGFYTKPILNVNGIDLLLLERLLQHIHHIKGTKDSINLFFMMFFNEDLSKNVPEGADWIKYPNNYTIAIDHELIIDGEGSIRDDNYYNEYSIAINTKYDREYYEPLFSEVYMRYIHPSGF